MKRRIPQNRAFTIWTHPEVMPGHRSPLSTAYEAVTAGEPSIIVNAFGIITAFFISPGLSIVNGYTGTRFSNSYIMERRCA